MAEPVSLSEAREQVRVDDSDAGEDLYLSSLILSARRIVEKRTNHVIAGDEPTMAGDDLAVAKQAMLLLIGHWFANREGATTDGRSTPVELPLAVEWLLEPLKKWADD